MIQRKAGLSPRLIVLALNYRPAQVGGVRVGRGGRSPDAQKVKWRPPKIRVTFPHHTLSQSARTSVVVYISTTHQERLMNLPDGTEVTCEIQT